MNILAVITMINQMEADGVIGRYAIGGAVGATFYLEPISTLDVDVFVGIAPGPGEIFVSLQPIYDYLLKRNCVIEKEYIVVEGTPVQFLPPGNPLVEEALEQAVEREVEASDSEVKATPARVFTAEHLAAIALQLGRVKDKLRLALFVEEGVLDMPRFESLLARHGLSEHWLRFKQTLE